MALPGSGQLSLSAIRDEFGAGTTSDVSLRTLSAAAGLSVPDGLNEFYGLSAYTPPTYLSSNATVTGSGTAASPFRITQTSWTQVDYWEDLIDTLWTWTGLNNQFRLNTTGNYTAYYQRTVLTHNYPYYGYQSESVFLQGYGWDGTSVWSQSYNFTAGQEFRYRPRVEFYYGGESPTPAVTQHTGKLWFVFNG